MTKGSSYLLSLRMSLVPIFLLLATAAGVGFSGSEHLAMSWNVPVTPPSGALIVSAEMKVDPEDSNHLIVCGTGWNAESNSYFGVVYVSNNSGKDWRVAFEDHATSWVTEHSCAFGGHHTAYFVSEASAIVDGIPHHDEGKTHIFRSADSGETWSGVAETDWADFSLSAVTSVPDQRDVQQLYVFYNGDSKYSSADKLGSTLDFFTVSDRGRVGLRQSVAGMADKNYQGVFPSSSAVLNDGTVVVLFNANKQAVGASGIHSIDIGVARFTPSGASSATIVASPRFENYSTPACPASISNSLAHDNIRGLLYVAFNDVSSGHCALMLARSKDQGKTWSEPLEFSMRDKSGASMYFPILAVNRGGTIGLLWRGKPQYSPDCWYFSAFQFGASSEDTLTLAPCENLESLSRQTSAYLMTHIRQPEAAQPAFVDLVSFRDGMLRVGMIATPDGVFHPIWPSLGAGFGELRTASVSLERRAQLLNPPARQAPKLTEVTNKVAVLYGGEQYLDHATDSIVMRLSLRNKSTVSLEAPLYVQVEGIESDFGKIELVNAAPLTLPAGYIDISSSVHGASLPPGDTTLPYSLTFHVVNGRNALLNRNYLAKLKLRLFCPCRP